MDDLSNLLESDKFILPYLTRFNSLSLAEFFERTAWSCNLIDNSNDFQLCVDVLAFHAPPKKHTA